MRYLEWDDVKTAVAVYIITNVEAFANQAFLAVRAREFPATRLDPAVEQFADMIISHAYYDLNDDKIRETWPRPGDDLHVETRQALREAPWYARYLDELHDVLKTLAADAAVNAPADSPEGKGQRRRAIISPRLDLKGWSVPRWAKEAGVNQSVAYDYMSGKSDPHPGNRKALAIAVGLEDLPD